MTISRNKPITDDEYNSLQWEELPLTPETLTAVFSGKQIINAETIDYPLTDGIIFALLDGEQLIFADASIDDDLLYGNFDDCERPLVLRVSEAVTFDPSPV